ncbi:AraC family transcriptional regulator [Breznakia pachnodae]|uniref:AraC family transcriptional regulator n=1 Tax=Breznakia pachnodae TaxID=265178 RepID=A0ABU0E748_9FIRM|nr:AraC family transcriptional regulator [Breznakia pachnodae]MDQ0362727.1 AraC family transcriptional regulator [Breznakia pachnodae]
MNWFDGFNKILDYIEMNLDGEIDYEKIADILGYSSYHCQRLFMMVAGISLADYIRSRRLSKAAEDLGNGEKVIDVAIKYGYSSSNSFNRAFKAMHNIAPSDARKPGAIIKAFPPLSFTFAVTGAEEMEYRIESHDAFRIVGKKLTTTMKDGICYEAVPVMWQNLMATSGPGEILALMDQPPFGLMGVSDYKPDLPDSQFDYFIAVSSSKAIPEGMASLEVPACTWAIFTCKNDNAKNIQHIQKRMVMEWLPSSGYEFGNAPDIELYDKDNNIELWLPVIKK